MDDVSQSGSKQPVPTGTPGETNASGVEAAASEPAVSALPRREGEPTEIIRPTDREPDIHPELSELGVEKAAEQPVVTEDQHDIGVRLSQPPMPSIKLDKTSQVASVQPPSLPISEKEAKNLAKGDVGDTRTWFGSLVGKLWQRFHRIK